ncbi:uncharacterized protein BO88DRAFT_447316 [Aspergillus vadensis CBS 113365]|uniref:Uncharacterized protein n=1 Tax=Aspergillus vadensis (strain CBS 113365 / IMI 142717 / IBT 24658) TaxID=1448311 RepID=A0A319AUC1_ASPVC|nr:hypothetical protein BO88DRAFT_447316 [Aspergillus vadensis CBS 113365]PYH63937.1 hypothetical protein BO88DRAFT_447316 [Aspergillus vadensis CBS 113365]
MDFNGRLSAGWASGHLCVCSLLPIAQGHMLALSEEQIPKPPPQMTMQASMCATHGTAPLVNRRLKYTTILGKRFQI